MASRSGLLRNRDLSAVLDALPELYGPTGDESWPERMVRAIRQLIDGTRVSYNVVDLRLHDARYCNDRVFYDNPRLAELVNRDPTVRDIRLSFGPKPLIFTDRMTTAQIRRTDLYNDYYRPQRVLHQMCVAVHRTPEHLYFAAIMRMENFTERERAVLAALQPHLSHVMTRLIPPPEWSQPRAVIATADNNPAPGTLSALRDLGLTPRQAEVLYWLSQGKRDGEIATIVDASVRTIHHHVEAILKRLHVENRHSAMLRAVASMGILLGLSM